LRGKANSKKLKRILDTGTDRVETDRLDDIVADTKGSSEIREEEKFHKRRARERASELDYLKGQAAEGGAGAGLGGLGGGHLRDADHIHRAGARDGDSSMGRLDRLDGHHAKGVDKIRRLDEELGRRQSGDAKEDGAIKAELHREKRKEKVKLVKALLNDLKEDSHTHRPSAARTGIDEEDRDMDSELRDVGGFGGSSARESELDAQVAKAKLLKGKRDKAAAAA